MGVRVWDRGGSESRPVTGRRGIERERDHPTGNRADFHVVLNHERAAASGAQGFVDQEQPGAAGAALDHASDEPQRQ